MKQLIGIALVIWMIWTPITCWAKLPLSSAAYASVHAKSLQELFWDDDEDDDGAW